MNAPDNILAYLKDQIPAYPFDPKVDAEFVQELIADFDHLDILEQTKTFRWYYNNQPATRFKNVESGCADGSPTPAGFMATELRGTQQLFRIVPIRRLPVQSLAGDLQCRNRSKPRGFSGYNAAS